MNVLKICSKCGIEKDIENFCKNKKTKDGFGVWCRDCYCAYFRTWQKENQAQHRAHSRKYYQTHKAEYKAYRQVHRERIITYQKAYRKFNGEYLNAVRRLKRKREKAKAAWAKIECRLKTVNHPAYGEFSHLQRRKMLPKFLKEMKRLCRRGRSTKTDRCLNDMANPQCERGYTKIANEIMEALIRMEMSGQELRTTLLVIRKTYGFRKKEDYISLSQIAQFLKTSKVRCSQIINKLQARGILTVKENINGLVKKYMFNKDFEQWRTVNENINRIEKTKEPLRKNLTTKEKEIKENNTKENILSKASKTFDIALKLSQLLLEEILKNNNSSRLSKKSEKEHRQICLTWSRDVDKLLRVDRQEPSIVEEVIRWSANHGFWGTNILSGRKLREKWDTLVVQKNRVSIPLQRASKNSDDRFSFLGRKQTGDNVFGQQPGRDAAGRILQNANDFLPPPPKN